MTESDRDFEREERAFRTALAARAEAHEPVDLALPAPRVRRGGWRRLGGIAAALVLIGGIITLVVSAGSDERPTTANGPVDGLAGGDGSLPIAHEGMRWASRYDVAVEVPTSWSYAIPPSRPDCIRTAADYHGPRAAYVAVDTEFMGGTLQGCMPPDTDAPKAFGPLLFQLWQPYVSFARAGHGVGPDGTWTYRGWTLTRWTLSGVQVSLVTGPGEEDLAQRVRASARTFTVDQNGCPATSPVQAKGFVRPPAASGGWETLSVSECQYDRTHGTGQPGLIGSRTLDGANLLTTIEKAPSGSGPNAPRTCTPMGETAIELLAYPGAASGPVPMYVYYDSCVGNGIFGNHTFLGGSSRQLTAGICDILFAEPEVAITEASASVGRLCMRS